MEADKIIVDELPEEEKKTDDILAGLNEAAKSFVASFGAAMRSLPMGKTTKHSASKRGAQHMHGSTFRTRQVLPMTPAQYRRYHFGKLNEEKK